LKPKHESEIPMSTTHHVLVALNLSAHVPDFIKEGRAIVTAMTGNPHFPAAASLVTTAGTAIDTLDTAETAALTRAKGTAEARNTALAAAKAVLHQLGGAVQTVADASGDQAEAMILSAGMAVRKVTPRQKQVFHAVQDVSGTVILFAVVVAHATAYNWQMSPDGKTWTSLPTTSKARTTVSGLTPGLTYSFRHEPVLTRGAAPEWSQVISILVT
jgi:hypothetical protein